MLDDHFHPEKRNRPVMISDAWKRFTKEAPVERFTALFDAVSEMRRQLQYNVNFQAVVEHFLFILMGEGNLWSV